MYETNFILKGYANKTDYKNNEKRIISMIARVKLIKPIYGAKFFILNFFYTTNYQSVASILRCDLVDKSKYFCFNKDSHKHLRPTDKFLVSNILDNNEKRKIKICDSKSTINEFEIESEFTHDESYNKAEQENSYFQITIYHTEN